MTSSNQQMIWKIRMCDSTQFIRGTKAFNMNLALIMVNLVQIMMRILKGLFKVTHQSFYYSI